MKVRYNLKVFSTADDKWTFESVLVHVYENEGKSYELVKIGVLARAIGRTNNCIVKWEREKKFPETRFAIKSKKAKLPGEGDIRWYSLKQVKMIQDHLIRLLNGKKPSSAKNAQFDHDKFFELVKKDWNIDD